MAMASTMQSLLASPVTRQSWMTTAVEPARLSGRVGLKVRSMAEEEKEEVKASEPVESVPKPNPTLSSAAKPNPSLKAKASTNFMDIFAFNGPAPERINGRLAMIGFVAAIAVEVANGTDVLAQINEGGAQWFLGTSILLSVASLVPLLKGERAEAKTEGLMNSEAELWNGRLAMLGLVALAFTEYLKGGALV